MIELAVLGVLKGGALHGYELKKRLQDVLPARSGISFGSLYPALNRLERDGAVAAATSSITRPMRAMPMTGSFAGEAAAFRASRRTAARGPRNKKVYELTPVGSGRLIDLIADPSDDDRSFPVKLAFCRFIDREERISLLARRRAALAERLEGSRHRMSSCGEGLDRYVRSLLQHEGETTERDIAWLDELLEVERAAVGDHTGGPAPAPDPDPAVHLPSPSDGHDPAPTANGGTR